MTCCTRIDMQFRSIHSECPLTAKTRLHYLSVSSLQFRLATPRDCEREERTNRNWFYVYALASLCLCSRQQQHQQQQQAKPLSVDAAFLPLSLHRHSNAKYAINKREPCEFLSKYTLSLPLVLPTLSAHAYMHACQHGYTYNSYICVYVCVRVCGYTPHIAFIAWRSLCCVVAVGVLVPLRHWPNKRADWLKISYDSVSQKRNVQKTQKMK